MSDRKLKTIKKKTKKQHIQTTKTKNNLDNNYQQGKVERLIDQFPLQQLLHWGAAITLQITSLTPPTVQPEVTVLDTQHC